MQPEEPGRCHYGLFKTEFEQAGRLFGQMDRLRRVWGGFHPASPMKRSDIALLGTIAELSRQGDGRVTASLLAKVMRQSMPAISQKVRLLEDAGYIRRQGDKTDRRIVYIELTEIGKDAAKNNVRDFLGRVERALDKLGPEKTDGIIALMGELSDAIEEVQAEENAENDLPL